MNSPVRILYVIDQLRQLGGAERNLLRLLAGLPRDRFEPRLLTFSFDPESFPSLPCSPVIYPLRRIYAGKAFRYAFRFRRLLETENIRIVHTFFESSDLWATPLARLSRPIVLISGRRDLGIQRHRFHDLAYRLVSPLFDQVQAVSEEVRQYLLRKDRLAPQRVVTIPNGIDLDAVRPGPRVEIRHRYGWSPGTPVVVSLGNVRPVKGYDMFVRAAALVCRHSDARFVIAGKILDVGHYEKLRVAIAEAGLEDRIQFLGAVERVYDLLAAADIFFLPSYSEGMSNALLEAMVCGLPAVATGVGGNPELITDGENGFLIPSGAADAAARRLLDLLGAPDIAHSMGEKSKALVHKRFSMAAMIARTTEEYERLLAMRGIG